MKTGCEKHHNVKTDGTFCPICLFEERDALRASLADAQARVGELEKNNQQLSHEINMAIESKQELYVSLQHAIGAADRLRDAVLEEAESMVISLSRYSDDKNWVDANELLGTLRAAKKGE